jgi:hypothetical protein
MDSWKICMWLFLIFAICIFYFSTISWQLSPSYINVVMQPGPLYWINLQCGYQSSVAFRKCVNKMVTYLDVDKIFVYLFECVGCWLDFLWICSPDRVYIYLYMYWSQCQAITLSYTMYVVLSIPSIKCLVYIGQLNSILLFIMDFFFLSFFFFFCKRGKHLNIGIVFLNVYTTDCTVQVKGMCRGIF